MFCTPHFISGDVVLLTGTCFYRSNLFERPCIVYDSSTTGWITLAYKTTRQTVSMWAYWTLPRGEKEVNGMVSALKYCLILFLFNPTTILIFYLLLSFRLRKFFCVHIFLCFTAYCRYDFVPDFDLMPYLRTIYLFPEQFICPVVNNLCSITSPPLDLRHQFTLI
jgi:hypothetical protein